jgi:hypothetical protein
VLTWRSPYELELGEPSPATVLSRAGSARRKGPQRLRLRVRGESIRARYMVGAASDASLLVARPVQRGDRTFLVGQMRWAAMFASILIRGVVPALAGLVVMLWGLADLLWPAVAIGAVLAASLGWMSLSLLRSAGDDQEAEQEMLSQALRELLGP